MQTYKLTGTFPDGSSVTRTFRAKTREDAWFKAVASFGAACIKLEFAD